MSNDKELIGKKLDISEIHDVPLAVWWIDNFGNCKTTLTQSEIEHRSDISKKFKNTSYYERLKDVPNKSPALISGSSGLGDKQFLEIIVQGGSAEKEFNISVET